MRLVTIEEEVEQDGTLVLHHLTDLHLGAPDFDEVEFNARVDLIEKDPRARWTFGGDLGDLIRHNDRRYAPTELEPRYRAATDIRLATREHARLLLGRIKDKCWGLCEGNHERKFDEFFGGKWLVEVACDLGLEDRYVGYRGFVHVKTTVQTRGAKLPFLIDLAHGWQAGRLKGAPLVQAERELGITEADIVLRGHSHQPGAHPFITLGVGGTGKSGNRYIRRRYRTVVNGGTWRRGYRDDLPPVDPEDLGSVEGDLWAETKGYRAEPLGGPVLMLQFDQGAPDRPAGISHTIIEGAINAVRLGF